MGWFRKKPMDLCACEIEEHEHGVGDGVNSTLMSDTLVVVDGVVVYFQQTEKRRRSRKGKVSRDTFCLLLINKAKDK